MLGGERNIVVERRELASDSLLAERPEDLKFPICIFYFSLLVQC